MMFFFSLFLVKPKNFNAWKTKYNWLRYDETKESITCSVCCEAVTKNLSLPSKASCNESKKAVVKKGFRTYKNALGAFGNHEVTNLHRNALMQISNCKNINIIEQFSSTKKKEMLENRAALKAIFTSVLYLGRQGLALRGHEEKNSNLHQLFEAKFY